MYIARAGHMLRICNFYFSRLKRNPIYLHGSNFVSSQPFWGGTCHCGYRCWAAQKASASVGKLHKRGSSEFVKFLDSDIKLSTMAQMDRGITTLYKKLIWAAHCPCWARAQNKHLFLFFLVCRPNKWMCTIQTMWAGSCSWWACDIEVTGAEGRAHQVSEGKTLLRVECEARSEVLS